MRLNLNEKDIQELRYQCRMGYVLPAMIFILGTILSVVIYESSFNPELKGLNIKMGLIIALVFLIISFFISYLMNYRYYSDIRYNEKIVEVKTVQRKMSMKDYEAGSGNMTTLPHNNPMKGFFRYDIVVDNVKYRIDKELFDNIQEGDEVLFFYAPRSKYRLSIEKK